MKRRALVLFCAAALMAAVPGYAEIKPTKLDKPILANVVLSENSEKVTGNLLAYDAEKLSLKTGKGDREIRWEELTAGSQYALRSQLANKKDAGEWLELAELAMRAGLREQAKVAVANAARIDPSTKLKGDAILRGQGNAKPSTNPNASAGAVSAGDVAKFQKSTPEQDAKAIKQAQEVAAGVTKEMKIEFAEIQTPHFIIFTDWDKREHQFLKDNCEGAYAAVSKQFDIPVKENVFVGKLPVFMFAKRTDFANYALKFDNFPTRNTIAGYYQGRSDGSGHMVMWKPDVARYGNVSAAERHWAYVLTHEFTHAFIARYRTNKRIPRWLNEGLAEVIAHEQFPKPESYQYAKYMANEQFDFEALFDDSKMPGGDMYPVMQTMVEALIRENRKGFLAMFNDIKDGMEPEEAMKKHYKAGYKDWEPAWRRFAKSLK
jgi:hypothetical protein